MQWDEQKRFDGVFAPETVAVPPGNPHRELCRLDNGEIRFYGFWKNASGERIRCYSSSLNQGLDWHLRLEPEPGVLGAMVKSPYSGDWITVLYSRNYNVNSCPAILDEPEGIYVIRSGEGPGGRSWTKTRIFDEKLSDIRQPLPLISRKRWICTGQNGDHSGAAPVVMLSDDDGVSWRINTLKSLPDFPAAWPSRGVRWQQGAVEPTVCELGNGDLLMLVRTSYDFHYQYVSSDGGETWSDPVPSVFHGTLTMPTLKRLRDGRLLCFWCNTQPMPEEDHISQRGCDQSAISGFWEDVFTNRDICHVAISEDDGKHWFGFRELGLNEIRNRADFRQFRSSSTNDKSVHQFEAMELDNGKILAVYGQAASSRRVVLFDLEWLYETARKEDFTRGLEFLSTYVYVKSLSGSRSPWGHCAWNRTNGALMVPSPDGEFREVLHLTTINDPRLYNSRQGVVWNFPAARKGEVVVTLKLDGPGIRFSLTDRWFNPCDDSVAGQAQFSWDFTRRENAGTGFWKKIVFRWDTEAGKVRVLPDGLPEKEFVAAAPAPAGFCYLHCQTVSEQEDFAGCYIRELSMSSAAAPGRGQDKGKKMKNHK